MKELVEKVAKILMTHDTENAFREEGWKFTEAGDIAETVPGYGDINLQAWICHNDYYCAFLGDDVKKWCSWINKDITKIKLIIAEYECCNCCEVTDDDIRQYILETYSHEIREIIREITENNKETHIETAKELIKSAMELKGGCL